MCIRDRGGIAHSVSSVEQDARSDIIALQRRIVQDAVAALDMDPAGPKTGSAYAVHRLIKMIDLRARIYLARFIQAVRGAEMGIGCLLYTSGCGIQSCL